MVRFLHPFFFCIQYTDAIHIHTQPTEFELRRKNAQFENKVRAGKTAVKPSRQERLAKRSPISLWALGIILFVVVVNVERVASRVHEIYGYEV